MFPYGAFWPSASAVRDASAGGWSPGGWVQCEGGGHPTIRIRPLLPALPPLFSGSACPVFVPRAAMGNGRGRRFSPILHHHLRARPPPELVGSALTLVNCIGFSITVVSLSLIQWLSFIGAATLPVDPAGRRPGYRPGLHEAPGRQRTHPRPLVIGHCSGCGPPHLRGRNHRSDHSAAPVPPAACTTTRLITIPWVFPKAMTDSGWYSPDR